MKSASSPLRQEIKNRTEKSAFSGVDIWRININDAAVDQSSLSEAEQKKAGRFAFERDRVRYVASHVAMRRILSQYTSLAPQEIQICDGQFGKPSMGPNSGWAFNLSHSENIGLLAVGARGQVGVDIEKIRPTVADAELGRRIFTDCELQSLNALDGEDYQRAFYTGWTRKEAYLKALGVGLNVEPRDVEVGIGPMSRRLSVMPPLAAEFVQVSSFNVCPGFAAALAVIGGVSAFQVLDYQTQIADVVHERRAGTLLRHCEESDGNA